MLIPDSLKKSQVIQTVEEGSKVFGLLPHEYELTPKGIPIYLDVLLSTFVNNPYYFSFEGIFRKNAAVSKENEIE